jgi:D-xylose transport system substrate-binding protein
VIASNDGTAGGAVAALTAQGLAGSVPVSGQDGDHAALNRIALGMQTVSVWKDARELGKTAGEAAMKLAKGTELAALPGTAIWSDGPRNMPMTSILLRPVPITKDNLDVVIKAGWVSRDVVCRGVNTGRVGPCG